jgi:cell wall-associated NlpC family hydrolase
MGRALGRLLCAVGLVALLFSPAAVAAPGDGAPSSGSRSAGLEALGRTVLTAIDASTAGAALDSLGNSFALLGARYEIETGDSGAPSAAASPPVFDEVVDDPSELPPASAGSNGSYTPRATSQRDEALFARTRAAAEEGSTAILLSGIALAPPNAPESVQGAINAANTIVGRPYVWGGGHGSWYSHGYDCSGAVSFALFGGGLIPRPLTSSDLMRWGSPGPGRWITVYANPGHTFVEIAGLRFDTVGNERGTGPRWHLAIASPEGYVARHPAGF